MGAVISACGRYRYSLTRSWPIVGSPDADLTCVWIMLNPSTADADTDDPTIRRCCHFAQRWGYSGIEVVNLFAFRATNPDHLIRAEDPVGPENNEHIRRVAEHGGDIVVGWGNSGPRSLRRLRVLQIEPLICWRDEAIKCLGKTREGQPRHPLYVPSKTPRQVWRFPR